MRHRFHSICPYFAMFPESFVASWIERIVPSKAIILDPFCGRGTSPFQALLMRRGAIACDVNPVAYCITRAKTNAPPVEALERRLKLLERDFDPTSVDTELEALPEFFHYAFQKETLAQILHLRRQLKWKQSDVECMLAGLALGSLHGESNKSRAYFSNQMPRTISPKPAYSIRFWKRHNLRPPRRNVFSVLRERIAFRYESGIPPGRATVVLADMRDLPNILDRTERPICYAITSPPYFDVTNFEEDQWLRLWFLGSYPRPTYGKVSRDDRHSSPVKYWEMISDLWRSLSYTLDSDAHIILRMGAQNQSPEDIRDCLLAAASRSERPVKTIGDFEVSLIKGRQTGSFRPGAKGCLVEVDFHFLMS